MNQTGLPHLISDSDNADRWSIKRNRIRKEWLAYIGGIPERVPAQVQILSETALHDHTRVHLAYNTVFQDKVTAYLLIPDRRSYPSDHKFPAVIALHSTHALGKDGIALKEKALANRQYALELVARGYVVLAPDALTAGERIMDSGPAFDSHRFYEQHPEWSTVAKNICDHRQGVDVLCSLPCVDAEAIGAIGHSFGAYNAYFLAGMDERVKAIVASCGISTFTGDPHPEHWGARSFPYTHLPKFTADLQQDRVPFEFNEIMALCAPTPFFVYAGQQDTIFPHWKEIGDAVLDLARFYQWLGYEGRFAGLIGSDGHDFPPRIRSLAYQFLDEWLKGADSRNQGGDAGL